MLPDDCVHWLDTEKNKSLNHMDFCVVDVNKGTSSKLVLRWVFMDNNDQPYDVRFMLYLPGTEYDHGVMSVLRDAIETAMEIRRLAVESTEGGVTRGDMKPITEIVRTKYVTTEDRRKQRVAAARKRHQAATEKTTAKKTTAKKTKKSAAKK